MYVYNFCRHAVVTHDVDGYPQSRYKLYVFDEGNYCATAAMLKLYNTVVS